MDANKKSIRDGIISGTPAGIAMLVCMRLGLSDFEAVAIAPVVTVVAARAYRALRARWPWLLAVDAPTGAK
jgi:hypothetical protein